MILVCQNIYIEHSVKGAYYEYWQHFKANTYIYIYEEISTKTTVTQAGNDKNSVIFFLSFS